MMGGLEKIGETLKPDYGADIGKPVVPKLIRS
jgi:hypothetical protein